MVLPNRNTIGLAALLVAMWYAGASQGNAAAYLLGFVLTGVAAVSMIHARANIHGVRLKAEPIKPAFLGDELCVRLIAHTNTRRPHSGLRVRGPGPIPAGEFPEITAEQPQRAELCLPALRRGRHPTARVRLFSLFPLGFFTAQRRFDLPQPHFIYPRPDGALPLPHSIQPALRRREGLRVEGDDFNGVRAYQPGESQRHIDWKAAARGQALLIKQWSGEADRTLHLDWEDLPQLPTEPRLSQLARWIVQAERLGASYGLRLPSAKIAPSHGDAHFHECLRALAAHPHDHPDGGSSPRRLGFARLLSRWFRGFAPRKSSTP